MSKITTSDIRNLILTGHMGAGKTTLADALLFAAGGSSRKGTVQDGTSISDFEKEEREHKHSIYASVLHFDYAGRRVNLIDTPGAADLLGQAIACLPAVETVAVVINATAGVELVTRRMMEAARSANWPRLIIVNKMDAPDVDFNALLKQIQDTFGKECLAINLPTRHGTGVIDCLLNNAGDSDMGPVGNFHAAILDQIVEVDEALMETYLGGEEPNYEALHAPFEKCLDEGHVIPICFTDAKSGAGVAELLDIILRWCPNPLEGNERPFLTGEGADERPFVYHNDVNRPLLAHVFKVTTDPFVGKLAYFRVHEGKALSNAAVFIGASKKPIKLNHVFHLQGKDHPECEELVAGDIGAVAKVEEIQAGDVLHDDHALDFVHLKPLQYPTPMHGLAVAPKTRGDEAKIAGAFHKIVEEDPTFTVSHDSQTHEMVIRGLGELHLRLILEKLKNRGLEVETKQPKIAYRETITTQADGHYRHRRQTGGAGQFGEVMLRVEPLERGQGFEFVDAVVGGAIPGQYLPAVEKGVRELLEEGFVGGYPLQDVRVTITDGKHHPVDSKEVAFKTAGKFAFRDALSKARPVLLEPIVTLEVVVPEDKMGAITGDMSSRRGKVLGTDLGGGEMVTIKAAAPLAEVTQYQSMLKSVTGGLGSFAMEMSHYEPTPTQVQQLVAAAYKPRVEEE